MRPLRSGRTGTGSGGSTPSAPSRPMAAECRIEHAPAGEACVCDLADCLGFRQPTVSHHLKIMTEAGLLNRERRGTWSWYSVNYDDLNRVRVILDPAVGALAANALDRV
ncbi:transcriptional regulator [Streptomyces viridosporus T7A]|uniref:Transcriptional regulator n=2 Tax=Streptomyces viridosporus TaxID=67581 RepID=A0ABX6A984_STRVD|nr:metalloregulator ArsR/SmtB family transcription factor [Streptomyces viridosporus]QEU83469.1 transcriptional regulator [Streptomyces viridosporus T7A]